MGFHPVIAGFVEMFGISNTVGYARESNAPWFSRPGWFNLNGSGNQPNYVMTVHMTPVLKLWNPYNRPLATSDYTLVVGNWDARDASGGSSGIECDLLWVSVRPSRLPAAMRFEHRYHIPATSFAPGEVKTFSLRKNTFLNHFGGEYRPQSGYPVGSQTDVYATGFILGELSEGPFTGHSFWDLNCTRPNLTEKEALAGVKYATGRGSGGWTELRGTLPDSGDGGDIVYSDSVTPRRNFSVQCGDLLTWGLELHAGRVPRPANPSGRSRPLVALRNLNTSSQGAITDRPNIPDLPNPVTEPYFAGNRFLDATWARRISLRMLDNEGDRDRFLYNPGNMRAKKVKWLADYNPRAPLIACWPPEFLTTPDPRYPGGPVQVDGTPVGNARNVLGTPGNYLTGLILNPTDKRALELNRFIGFSDQRGVESCILFEVPQAEPNGEPALLTTGRLRHAHLTIQNGDPDALFRQGHGAETWFPDNANPAWPIGSSRADPRLMPDQHLGLHRTMTVSYQGRSHTATHYDLSWHLNNALWDRVFFSEPSRQQPLSRNPRHVIRPGLQLANEGREAIATNAASLLIEGAFNVHAAEPEAWTALLLAAMGEKPGQSPADPLRTPFPRQTIPSGAMATETTAASDIEAYTGFRALSTQEARDLAARIVTEIRRRAPFFSVAEFINRSAHPSAPQELQLKGALQSAIDATAINNQFTRDTTYKINPTHVGPAFHAEAFAGDVAAGVPGYLDQGDLLASMGHLLAARSDTFVIRAYGAARGRDGTRLASAWCEAVVQRFPEFTDPADPPETARADLTRELNRRFGRRFDITSFRWLSPEEFQ